MLAKTRQVATHSGILALAAAFTLSREEKNPRAQDEPRKNAHTVRSAPFPFLLVSEEDIDKHGGDGK